MENYVDFGIIVLVVVSAVYGLFSGFLVSVWKLLILGLIAVLIFFYSSSLSAYITWFETPVLRQISAGFVIWFVVNLLGKLLQPFWCRLGQILGCSLWLDRGLGIMIGAFKAIGIIAGVTLWLDLKHPDILKFLPINDSILINWLFSHKVTINNLLNLYS